MVKTNGDLKYYDIPIKVKCIDESSNGKFIKVGKTYKCIGEYIQSSGTTLYMVTDETRATNFHKKDKFSVLGNWEERIVSDESVTE